MCEAVVALERDPQHLRPVVLKVFERTVGRAAVSHCQRVFAAQGLENPGHEVAKVTDCVPIEYDYGYTHKLSFDLMSCDEAAEVVIELLVYRVGGVLQIIEAVASEIV